MSSVRSGTDIRPFSDLEAHWAYRRAAFGQPVKKYQYFVQYFGFVHLTLYYKHTVPKMTYCSKIKGRYSGSNEEPEYRRLLGLLLALAAHPPYSWKDWTRDTREPN
jgi:hypothetical protein